jgi:hypothetical protein
MTGFEPNSHRSTRRPGGRIATIATRYESVEERVHELFAIPATGLATTALGERWPRYPKSIPLTLTHHEGNPCYTSEELLVCRSITICCVHTMTG